MQIPVSTPSAQGIDPTAIAAFLDAIEADPGIEPHGLIIQRHGHRVAEGYWAPHTATQPRLMYSLSKTFTGTALALQLGEGRLTLDDRVRDHLPEAFIGADPGFADLAIRHIASMNTGHDRETLGEAWAIDPDDPVRGSLHIPPSAPPGSLFAYNQPPVVALAEILQKQSGERLLDYLRPRLFEPLGMGPVYWAQIRPGLDFGFSGVYTNLDAIARLGQLYLDDGCCNGRRLLPEGWVADASCAQSDNSMREDEDWRHGYGFQLWCSQHGYRGDGAFGQYMVILPEQDAVIAMVSCVESMQRVLDLMWEHLLPALGAGSRIPAATMAESDAALAARLADLTLPGAASRHQGRAPESVDGHFEPGPAGPNSHRTLTGIDVDNGVMTLHEGTQSFSVPIAAGWVHATGAPVAASACTLADGTLLVDIARLDTPHRLEIRLSPDTGQFTSHWPMLPLFVAGAPKYLGEAGIAGKAKASSER